jgi:class 3 adenylate cyclase
VTEQFVQVVEVCVHDRIADLVASLQVTREPKAATESVPAELVGRGRDRAQDLGIPPMQFGIGMNSGEVVAAHVGGGKRRQYDIVGDTVNLASRLCGQAGKGEPVAR